MIGTLTLFTFALGKNLYGLQVGRTMAFFNLSALELVHSFNIKSEESIFKTGIFNNLYLVVAVIIGLILQAVVIIQPKLAQVFDSVPLNSTQWLLVGIVSILPIIIIEIQKAINTFKFGKVIYPKKEAMGKL